MSESELSIENLQPSYGLAKMSSLVRPSSLFDSVSSWRQGSSEAEFPPSASRGPGRRRHVLTFFDTDLTNTSLLATFFYIQTCTHFWTLSRTFLGVCTHPYTGARVSSTYARTHVPTPRRFLSKPSAAFYVYLFLLLFLCDFLCM